jgi:hypothetical protein
MICVIVTYCSLDGIPSGLSASSSSMDSESCYWVLICIFIAEVCIVILVPGNMFPWAIVIKDLVRMIR